MKMENLFNISSLKSFQDYDSRDLFNSTCESFGLYDILNMTGILFDDTNNLLLKIKSNDYYNSMKTKFENQLESFKIKEESFQVISNLFHSDYLSGLFYFSPNKRENHTNYAEKILNNFMENNIEKKINDIIFNFRDTLENKLFNYTNDIAYKTIFSTFDIYTNLINNKTKTLTENDILKNVEYGKANNNKDTMIKFIDKFHLFAGETTVNGKNEYRLSLKIDTDISNSLNKFAKNALQQRLNEEDVYDDEDVGSGYSIDIIFSEDKVALEACYIVDLVEKYSKGFLPLNITCPKFPELKLTIEPIAKYNVCFAIEYIDDTSIPINQLSFDFSCGAEAGLYAKLGIFLDRKFASANLTLDMERFYFTGKIGIKLSIDFREAKIILSLYAIFSGAILRVKIIGKVKFLRREIELFNLKLIDKELKPIKLERNITLYLNNLQIKYTRLIEI